MSFSVTVLGSAAMFATQERAASGYLLRLDGKNLWLDAGTGTWRNLLRYIAYSEIHGVILSHHHPDHTTDVFQAYHARMYGQPEPMPAVPLWAPRETIERCVAYAENMAKAFDVHPVTSGDTMEFAGARFGFFDMAHPPETLGVRVEVAGKVFAYSADTGPDADFGPLCEGADLFICEATFQAVDEEWEGHLHAETAAEIASRYGVRRLVLTHLPPARDLDASLKEAVARAGSCEVELAADGKVYEL